MAGNAPETNSANDFQVIENAENVIMGMLQKLSRFDRTPKDVQERLEREIYGDDAGDIENVDTGVENAEPEMSQDAPAAPVVPEKTTPNEPSVEEKPTPEVDNAPSADGDNQPEDEEKDELNQLGGN